MIGTKLYKDKYTNTEYANLAVWCNTNNATIVDQGEYYECIEIPAPSLEELKTSKLTEVDAWTADKITGGFVSTCFNGIPVKYDTDRDTQLTMTKARANCEGERFAEAFPEGMGVRGYEQTGLDDEGNPTFASVKTVYNFMPEHIIAWDEDFSLFLAQCKYEGWIKQAEVEAAESKEALDAIVLD